MRHRNLAALLALAGILASSGMAADGDPTTVQPYAFTPLQPKSLRAVLLSHQNQPAAPADLLPAKPASASTPAPTPRKWGSRSKPPIIVGLAILGGGLAMAITNPSIDDFQNELSSPNKVRWAGISIMGPGAYLLWDGLRKR